MKVSEINAQNPAPGVYRTEGFIAKIYTCPPCPSGALCKPCMKDNVVLSEDNKTLDSYDLTAREIIVFTDQTKSLLKGQKYLLKIRITDQKTTAGLLNDIELLGFQEIKDQDSD